MDVRIGLAICFCSFGLAHAVEPVVGWRGDGSGSFPTASPPQTWSKTESIAWKTELPGRGYSSPVLFNGRLYLTAEPSHALCCDAATGAILWKQVADYATVLGAEKAAEIKATQTRLDEERRVVAKKYEEARKADPASKLVEELKTELQAAEKRRHDYDRVFPSDRRGGAGNAAGTPICDGQRVYVVFGTGIVAAFGLDGQPLWATHIEATHEGYGHSASPVLADGKVIVHFHNLVALDAATGKEAWRTELSARFGTPVVATINSTPLLISPAGAFVRASDGRILAQRQFEMSNNSPLVHDGVVYAHGSGKVKAIKLPTAITEPLNLETLWETTGTRDQRMASAVYLDGLLYGATRSGILDVTDAKTGSNVYRKRLEIGEVFSSLTSAGPVIFVCGNDSKTLVLRPGREYAEVALNSMERINSSPLADGKRLFLRTDKHLVCLGF